MLKPLEKFGKCENDVEVVGKLSDDETEVNGLSEADHLELMANQIPWGQTYCNIEMSSGELFWIASLLMCANDEWSETEENEPVKSEQSDNGVIRK